jgi:hypothetical protein
MYYDIDGSWNLQFFARGGSSLLLSPLVKSCICVGTCSLDFCNMDRQFCENSTSPFQPKTCHLDFIARRIVKPKKHNTRGL